MRFAPSAKCAPIMAEAMLNGVSMLCANGLLQLFDVRLGVVYDELLNGPGN